MHIRFYFILALLVAAGCNTFADVPVPQIEDVSDADVLDGGATDAATSDATSADASDQGNDGAIVVDSGGTSLDFRVLPVSTVTFDGPHRLETSIALLSDGNSGHLFSLAYRHDPNFGGDDGFVISTSVDTPNLSAPFEDSHSGNEGFESVTIMRDPTDPTEFLFSMSFARECASTLAVVNSFHMIGAPGDATIQSAGRDCDTESELIDVDGNIERFLSIENNIRFALLTSGNVGQVLSTSTPTSSVFNYVEVELSSARDQILAAPGLIATADTDTMSLDLWSGVAGEAPQGAIADPRTQASIPLGMEFDHLALSGALPTRYELWTAQGNTLEMFGVPCEVKDSPLGELDCSAELLNVTSSITFGGEIVSLDAMRSGSIAIASVLVNEGGEHVRRLVVFDGVELEAYQLEGVLGDLTRSHISVDAIQVQDSDDRLVVIATSYLSIDEGSTVETLIDTYRLIPAQ